MAGLLPRERSGRWATSAFCGPLQRTEKRRWNSTFRIVENNASAAGQPEAELGKAGLHREKSNGNRERAYITREGQKPWIRRMQDQGAHFDGDPGYVLYPSNKKMT